MLKTAKDYAPHLVHFILAGLFLAKSLITLCQPLEANIWAVILIKTITSTALRNGKQNCRNERLSYNELGDNVRRDKTRSQLDLSTDRKARGLTDSRRGPMELGKCQLELRLHFPHFSMSGQKKIETCAHKLCINPSQTSAPSQSETLGHAITWLIDIP